MMRPSAGHRPYACWVRHAGSAMLGPRCWVHHVGYLGMLDPAQVGSLRMFGPCACWDLRMLGLAHVGALRELSPAHVRQVPRSCLLRYRYPIGMSSVDPPTTLSRRR